MKMLKKIGFLWKQTDKHDQPYFAGTIDAGIFGQIKIMVFTNSFKKKDGQPDATINIILDDKNGKEEIPS